MSLAISHPDWLQQDPDAAWDWYQDTRGGWDGAREDFILYMILRGTSLSDPSAALHRAVESGMEEFSFLSPERSDNGQKIATLSALRAWSEGESSRQGVFEKYVRNATLNSSYRASNRFDDVTDWIETAELTTDEIGFLVDPGSLDLSFYIEPHETGKWIEWLTGKFPEGRADVRIRQLFEDHRTKSAAQAWLDSLPPDRAKVIEQCLSAE